MLDIIDIPLLYPRPRGHQQENWVIDSNSRWVKAGSVTPGQITALAATSGPLWKNGWRTQNGLHDCLPAEEADPADGSLKLIYLAHGLNLRVFTIGENFGNPRRRVQADFHFGGVQYNITVTDPIIERAYRDRAIGEYALGASYLTISLGEKFADERCHKFVAAIIGA